MAKVPARLRRELSRRVQREMSALLSRQSTYVAAQLRAHTITAATITASPLDTLPADYLDPNDAENELADTLSPILRDAAQLSGASIAKSLRAPTPYSHDPALDSLLNTRARTIAATITNTTLTDLTRLIRNAEDDEEAADEVEAYGARDSRSALIALMEVGFAISAGTRAATQQVAQEKNAAPTKTWVLSPDHPNPDWCDDYAAVGPIGLDDEWDDGDPPAHVGCGCELEVDLTPNTEDGNMSASSNEETTRPTIFTVSVPHSTPATITAAASGDDWHAIALPEGVMVQGREFAPGSISTRDLPLPLMYMTENGEGGHEGARLCGAITSATRDPESRIVTTGVYDTGEDGQEAQRLATPNSDGIQMLRWVSSDIEVVDYEEVYDPATDESWFRCTRGNLMGITMCPFPWYASCIIAPTSIPLPDAQQNGEDMAQSIGTTSGPLAIAACANWGDDNLPPISYFSNPNLTRPTLPTVDENGRVYGHIARWDLPHIGYQNRQVYAPKSQSNYAYFMTGRTRVKVEQNGDVDGFVRTGRLVMNTTHPDLSLSHHAAATHYDHTGSCVADIVVGEDEHGIWYSGAVRGGINEAQYRVLQSSGAVSGDWRGIGGNLEMVGLLVVNAPGFPIGNIAAAASISIPVLQPRGRVESGEMVALVAAGCPASSPMVHHVAYELEQLRQRLDRVEAPQLRSSVKDLAARIGVEV